MLKSHLTLKPIHRPRMRMRILPIVVAMLLATGCAATDRESRPQLVGEQAVTPEAFVMPTLNPLANPPTEVNQLTAPLTVNADFAIVTPTEQPSKTPDLTATSTTTPTIVASPTMPVTATETAWLLPTSPIIAITQPVVQPAPRICDSAWFFIEPRPESCPLNPALASQGVFQRFQNGLMFWIGSQDAIYVLYDDAQAPRWQVFRDVFDEGMPEDSDEYASPPYQGVWQPRRGFGMLWRNNILVRERIGWAVQQLEQPYSVQIQTDSQGVAFVNDPTNVIYALSPAGQSWQKISGGSWPATAPIAGPTRTPISIPAVTGPTASAG
jgi:hypothetical protein